MRLSRRLLSRTALAAVALLVSTACADAAASGSDSSVDANTPATAAAASAAPDTARDGIIARADVGRIEGRESAKVWMVVISDFQCPFCKRWHEQTMPQLIREYVQSGKVRIAYLNLPISTHRNAQPAHEAAMCAAEQDAFWPVADALFATQQDWKSKFEVEPYFDSLATRHVRDVPRFRRCMRDGHVRQLIATDVSRITRLGVGSTPTFLVGNQMIVGAQPYEAFARALDAAIAAAPR
jgi:protein-disulfide isomerase